MDKPTGVWRGLAGRLGHGLVRDDVVLAADAIVVLGGDAVHRVPHAAALFHQGISDVVVAVGGVENEGREAEAWLSAAQLHSEGVPKANVVVLGAAEPNTKAEARAVMRLFEERGWRRCLVVTSPYHSWRAGRVFSYACRHSEVTVQLAPSPYDPFDPDGWWRDSRQRRQVRNEWIKFAWWCLSRGN